MVSVGATSGCIIIGWPVGWPRGCDVIIGWACIATGVFVGTDEPPQAAPQPPQNCKTKVTAADIIHRQEDLAKVLRLRLVDLQL